VCYWEIVKRQSASASPRPLPLGEKTCSGPNRKSRDRAKLPGGGRVKRKGRVVGPGVGLGNTWTLSTWGGSALGRKKKRGFTRGWTPKALKRELLRQTTPLLWGPSAAKKLVGGGVVVRRGKKVNRPKFVWLSGGGEGKLRRGTRCWEGNGAGCLGKCLLGRALCLPGSGGGGVKKRKGCSGEVFCWDTLVNNVQGGGVWGYITRKKIGKGHGHPSCP